MLFEKLYPMNLVIHDETRTGSILNQLKIHLSHTSLTAKELIRERVYQEVKIFNNRRTEFFHGLLVQPAKAERVFDGYRIEPSCKLDPEKQYYMAMHAFNNGDFFLMVGEERIVDPEKKLDLSDGTHVSFLKIRPLIGG
jgi:hypothetical protein